jgi:hypothetical protein
MFNKKRTPEEHPVDKALADAYLNLAGYNPEDKEHAKTVKQIAALLEIKAASEKKPRITFSQDAMLTAGASLLGILLILNYERANVVASKALGFVSKSKI